MPRSRRPAPTTPQARALRDAYRHMSVLIALLVADVVLGNLLPKPWDAAASIPLVAYGTYVALRAWRMR